MSSKPRQRSEISLSLASVLVISVKVRRLSLKVSASASAACLAHRAVGVLQQVERRLERQLLAVDLEAQRRHRLVEQPVPGAARRSSTSRGRAARCGPRAGRACPCADRRSRAGSGRTAGSASSACVDQRVVDPVEFEREEQQMRAGVGHLLLHVAVELGALRIGRVAGIDEAGIGDDAADQFFERLVVAQRLRRARPPAPLAASAASLPFQRVSKAAASLAGALDVAPSVPAHPCRDRGRRGPIPAGRRAPPLAAAPAVAAASPAALKIDPHAIDRLPYPRPSPESERLRSPAFLKRLFRSPVPS